MIRVLLAHSSHLICDSFSSILEDENGVYVTGSATTRDELFYLLPHVNAVLLGAELKDATAFEILEEVSDSYPEVNIIVVGVNNQPDTLVNYIEAGAIGYILQSETSEDIIAKLRAASDERALISPKVAAAMMDRLTNLANHRASLPHAEVSQSQYNQLTPRQREVLSLINKGYTNREIADTLYIQCGTVKNHVHHILKKLDVNNRHEAATVFRAYRQPHSSPASSQVASR